MSSNINSVFKFANPADRFYVNASFQKSSGTPTPEPNVSTIFYEPASHYKPGANSITAKKNDYSISSHGGGKPSVVLTGVASYEGLHAAVRS